MPNSYTNLCILSELAGAGLSDYGITCLLVQVLHDLVAAAKHIKSHCWLGSHNNNKSPQSHLGFIKGEESRTKPWYKWIKLIADNQRKVKPS